MAAREPHAAHVYQENIFTALSLPIGLMRLEGPGAQAITLNVTSLDADQPPKI